MDTAVVSINALYATVCRPSDGSLSFATLGNQLEDQHTYFDYGFCLRAISFCFSILRCGRLSWPAFWPMFGRTIN